MKQTYFLASILLVGFPAANAVDFNKDALKAMQTEGHKIVAESEGSRIFKAGGGFCLDSAGPNVVIKQCKGSQTQKWSLNEQKQLVAHNGNCVDSVKGNAKLKKCGGAPSQKWHHDGKNRLANNENECLQFQGEASAGSLVVAAPCNNSARQVWN